MPRMLATRGPAWTLMALSEVDWGLRQGGRQGSCSCQALSECKVLRPPLSAACVGARLLAPGLTVVISGMTLAASLGRRRIVSFECRLFTWSSHRTHVMDGMPVRTSWLSAQEDYRCLGPEKGEERLGAACFPPTHFFPSFLKKYLFISLYQVLDGAHGIRSSLQHAGSFSLRHLNC